MPEDSTQRDGSVSVFVVRQHASASDGRVTISTGGVTFDGYQTDDGMFLEGEQRNATRGRLAVTAFASPGELPLSYTSGLYDLRAESEMHYKDIDPVPVSWAGEAAAIVANDSLYLDVVLTNTRGGSTGTTVAGPLHGDRFDMDTGDTRLWGTVRDGRLRMQWVERRDWGRYEGTITGQRK